MLKTFMKNPVPAALVGVGLYWLMKNPSDVQESNWRSYPSYPPTYGPPDYGGPSKTDELKANVLSAADTATEQMTEWKDQASERAQEWKEQASRQTQEWKDQAGQRAQQWKDQATRQAHEWKEQANYQAQKLRESTERKMGEVKGYLQDQATVARGEFNYHMQNNPLIVGAIMVAVGAAVAAALPGSRREDEWVGESRDKMMQGIKSKIKYTVDDVSRTTGEAVKSALAKDERY